MVRDTCALQAAMLLPLLLMSAYQYLCYFSNAVSSVCLTPLLPVQIAAVLTGIASPAR